MRERKGGGRFVCALLVVCCTAAAAQAVAIDEVLHWRLYAADTTISVGQPTLVTVSAWVENATEGNGLDTWQTDVNVDLAGDGVVAITTTGGLADIDILAPDPYEPIPRWDPASVNNPVTGEVRDVSAIVATENLGNPSDIGVGAFTDLFSFTIIGLAPGEATFTLTKDWAGGGWFGFLVDSTLLDNTDVLGSVVFDAAESFNVITVQSVPEPTSALLLLTLSGLAWRRRKRR